MSEEELLQIPVNGSASLFLNRLDEEYLKSLQRLSPHTIDYVVRLRDETKLVDLFKKMKAYFERVGSTSEAAELAQLHIEHIYYRHDSIAEKVDRAAKMYESIGDSKEAETESTVKVDSRKLMSELCTYVYQYGSDKDKTNAILKQIYNLALHDEFLEARDLLLMSHLQDNISNVGDVSTMILFNRMTATLGLSAFRIGKIWDAHQCLSDVCSGRVRELLAQGISTGRYAGEKTVEEEKAEKRRQVPFHQHISLDLLEACHLISAMLLEVPNMAAGGDDSTNSRKTRVISRTFRKNHDMYTRQIFTGPPEQTRDYVMCATKALMKGDWKRCADLLTNLEAWLLIPNENAIEQIRTMLVEKIKLEGLRTYLYAYSSQYDSLCLKQLCSMFDLSKNEVHSVVSKMMINRELHASWDQPTETIVLRKVESSNLQMLAMQFADKASNLVESNERLFDVKSGNHGFGREEGQWKSDQQRNYYQQNQRRGGGRGGSGGRGGRGGGRGRGRNSNRTGGRGNSHRNNRNRW